MNTKNSIVSCSAASLLLVASSALAGPVIGSSGGYFSHLSSCDYSGSDRDCRIVDTAANGEDTQVQWGSTSWSRDFVQPSLLNAVDLDINFDTDTAGAGVAIARLDWYNSATLRLNSSLDNLGVRWTLGLNFTSPGGPDGSAVEGFNLGILNPVNPQGDYTFGFNLSDLNNIASSIDLGGVTMTNLRYSVTDGAGSGSSWFAGNTWYNSEYNWSSLYILADFAANPTSVPEPGSLALLGLGLLVTSLAAKRRRKNA